LFFKRHDHHFGKAHEFVIFISRVHRFLVTEETRYSFWTLTFLSRNAVKRVYNDHPRDPKIVVVADRWSLFRGHLCNKSSIRDHKMVVVTEGGRYSEVVVRLGLTVFVI
jgi:hypothetical protein